MNYPILVYVGSKKAQSLISSDDDDDDTILKLLPTSLKRVKIRHKNGKKERIF